MNRYIRTGLIRENLEIAIDVLMAHKLRSGLIILGVSIGVASLIGMVSILLGLRASIVEEISNMEQNVLTVQKYDYDISGFDESIWRRKNIEAKHAQAIDEQCQSLSHVTFAVESFLFSPTLSYKNEKSRNVAILATEPSMFYIYSMEMEDGRMFANSEVYRHAKVVVIGHSPRRNMFPNIDPIGKKININDNEFTIIGTLAPRNTIGGEASDNFVIIPYTTYDDSLSSELDMPYIMAAVRNGFSLDAARDEVIQVMRVQRRLKTNQDNDFSVYSIDAALDLLTRITAPIALILTAISSIALLVGGIGVMNMMLVSVTERTNEIGIRKSVGAIRQHILWQFLIEAGTLTGLGGILGVAFGLSIALGISRLIGVPFNISPVFILLAVAFSISIGMFFGLYPAYRASKLSPITAIGYAK